MVEIPIGPAVVLTQNTIYALPAISVIINSTLALESSLDGVSFTAFTSAIANGAYVRCTTGSPTVKLKDNTAG